MKFWRGLRAGIGMTIALGLMIWLFPWLLLALVLYGIHMAWEGSSHQFRATRTARAKAYRS